MSAKLNKGKTKQLPKDKTRCQSVCVSGFQADIFIEHLKTWAVKTLREDYGRQDDLTAIWDTTMKEVSSGAFRHSLWKRWIWPADAWGARGIPPAVCVCGGGGGNLHAGRPRFSKAH